MKLFVVELFSCKLDHRGVFVLAGRGVTGKQTELKHRHHQRHHVRHSDKGVLDYDSVHRPDGREDDAVEDEGEGEGLGGLCAHHVGDGGQGGEAVADGQGGSEQPYPELGSLQALLIDNVGLHQDEQEERQEDLLPRLDLGDGVAVEHKAVDCLKDEARPVYEHELGILHQAAVAEPDECHHGADDEGHAGGLPCALLPMKTKTHLNSHQKL